MSVRIQSAISDAMAQRRVAAGFTETRRLSGSTMASSRTRSSPPHSPGPLMSGMLGAMAIASVRASRQADGGGGAGGAGGDVACSAGLSVAAGAGFAATGFSGSVTGASAGRDFGNGIDGGIAAARRGLGLGSPKRSPHRL